MVIVAVGVIATQVRKLVAAIRDQGPEDDTVDDPSLDQTGPPPPPAETVDLATSAPSTSNHS